MAYFRYNMKYKYKEFPFSEEATQYSKKIAFYNNKVVRIVIGFLLFCVIAGVLILAISFIFPNMNEDMIFPFLVISMMIGIVLSIFILRYNDQRLLNKRNEALKRDLYHRFGPEGQNIFQEITTKEKNNF